MKRQERLVCPDTVSLTSLRLVYTSLNDVRLTVSGQTSLSCRFMSGISIPNVDKEGKAIYEEGGIYEVTVAQSRPQSQTLTVTLDSTIA